MELDYLLLLSPAQHEPALRPVGALDERRRSLRLPVAALVLYVDGQPPRVGCGDVSTGGVRWLGRGPGGRLPSTVTLGVRLPGMEAEARVAARVRSVRSEGDWTEVRAAFTRSPRALRCAIGRYVEDWFLIADASGVVGS